VTTITTNTTGAGRPRIKALDLFAGTGWGVACRRLGIKEAGVEIMDEAVATRTANGMETIYRDVWDGLLLTAEQHRAAYGSYGLLIASPPCQTFSLAGKGAGRDALNEVIEAIQLHAYKDAAALRAFGEAHDMRTALVLSPLAYVWRDRPRLVAMEQVPTVLPVWEACAEVMREWGYDVKVEILNAEQYGVPQTRRRAILVARRGGDVHLPVPTHSRYYNRTPDRLDPGVLKWVSMAEALGWGMVDQPMPTITGGVHGPTDRWASGGNSVRKMIDGKIGTPAWRDRPVTPGVDARTKYADRIDVREASIIQTYPVPQEVFFQTSHRPNNITRPLTHPAPTVIGGNDTKNRGFKTPDGKMFPATEEEIAALQTYPPARGLTDRPSPTITGGGTETGGAEPIAKLARYTGAPGWTGSTERLSTGEAGTLQSYPPEPEFIWCGSKSKKFLQIGNAVPPLMGEAVLAALIGVRPGR
jgi:DNA (cytosine-5)-methyltransferase 1